MSLPHWYEQSSLDLNPSGMRLTDWLALWSESPKSLLPGNGFRLARLTVQSGWNELIYRLEEGQLSSEIEQQQPKGPIFLLGLPTEGAGALQGLLSLDKNFGYPNAVQAYNPHAFFFIEQRLKGPLSKSLFALYALWVKLAWNAGIGPTEARHQPPQEDEIALAMLKCSPETAGAMLAGLKPQYYDYFTLRDLEPSARELWERDWLRYLKKLTLRHDGKPLVLRSTYHTARVKTILKLFPDAKFIHIHRHPYEAAPPLCYQLELARQSTFSKQLPSQDLDHFLGVMDLLYSAYLEDRELIPDGQLHTLDFESFEADPVASMEATYRALALPDFENSRASFQAACDAAGAHQWNRFPEPTQSEKKAIADSLAPYFEAFGYKP